MNLHEYSCKFAIQGDINVGDIVYAKCYDTEGNAIFFDDIGIVVAFRVLEDSIYGNNYLFDVVFWEENYGRRCVTLSLCTTLYQYDVIIPMGISGITENDFLRTYHGK